MSDVEKIANRLLLLEKGNIEYDGNLEQFKNLYQDYQRVEIQGVTEIKMIPGVTIYQKNKTSVTCLIDSNVIPNTAFIQQIPLLTEQEIRGITVLPNDLEMILLLRAHKKGGY